MSLQMRRPPARAFSLGCAIALCGTTFASTSVAQDAAALATRRELIAQAQQARTSGNHQQALELAERASRIQMSPSLRLFVAQEQVALGRVAEAYGNADLCMREAAGDTTLRNREQVTATCTALTQDLRSRIARVVVQVPSPAPTGLTVRVAGNPVSDSLWGVPYVVSPGHLVIEASAPRFQPFHTEVDVAAGATSDVRVQLEAEAGGATHGETPAVAQHSTAQPTRSGVPVAPIAVMGVGAVGIILAPVFFFALRAPAYARATAICPDFTCPDEAALASARADRDAASTWNTITFVSLGVGVAALAGGLAWFLVSRPRASSSRAFHVVPTGDGVAVGVSGMF